MEAKYLKDQDSGEIYYPLVHIDGILDLNTDKNYVSQKFEIGSSIGNFAAGGIISYREYIGMKYVDITATLNDNAKASLIDKGSFIENLPEDFPKDCKVRLGLICKTAGTVDGYCTVNGTIEGGQLIITAIVNETINGTTTNHTFDTISGCGYNY